MPRRAVVITEGSRGDVEPMIGVALALEKRNWEVSFAANYDFEEFCTTREIKKFLPLQLSAKDVIIQLMHDLAGTMTAEDIQMGITKWRFRTIPYRTKEFQEYCKNMDLVIVHGNLNTFAMQIAEAYKIPTFICLFAPWFPTPQVRPCFFAGQHTEDANYLPFYHLAFASFTENLLQPVNNWRETLGLAPLEKTELALMEQLLRTKYYVNCWSPAFTPEGEGGYPDNVFYSGFLRKRDDSLPSNNLLKFMERCEKDNVKPVYMGFGSATHPRAQWFSDQVIRASEKLISKGHRIVLCEGWGALQKPKKSMEAPVDSYIFIEDTNHSWLFPKCSCAVIHGGAGTSAAAAEAGIPMIVTPVLFDQAFWGNCVGHRRLGPFPIQADDLTPEALCEMVESTLLDENIAMSVKNMSDVLRNENGIETLLNNIEKRLCTSSL